MSQYLFQQPVVHGDPDCVYCHAGVLHTHHMKMGEAQINHCPFGYIVMVRDRGQDEPRRLPKIYPDHPAAICVKHNLQDTGRYNSVWVRDAVAGEEDLSEA